MIKNIKVISIFLSCILLLFLSSCDQIKSSNFWNNKSKYDCISNTALPYDEILSLKDLRDVLPVKMENIKIESNGSPSIHVHGYCYYTWSSDRLDKKSELSEHILIPDNNYVRIENYKRHDIELTQKEIIQSFYEEIRTQDKDLRHSNLKSDANKTQDVLEFTEDDIHYFWKYNPPVGGKMIFLKNNEELEIGIRISDNAEENFKVAKELAQIIFNKC